MKMHGSTHSLTILAAALRACITDQGVPDRCPLRKCRRDRFCTGPLYTRLENGTELCLLAAADIDDVRHSTVLPVCILVLEEAAIEAVTAHMQALQQPVTVLSPDRAIAARRWSQCGPLCV